MCGQRSHGGCPRTFPGGQSSVRLSSFAFLGGIISPMVSSVHPWSVALTLISHTVNCADTWHSSRVYITDVSQAPVPRSFSGGLSTVTPSPVAPSVASACASPSVLLKSPPSEGLVLRPCCYRPWSPLCQRRHRLILPPDRFLAPRPNVPPPRKREEGVSRRYPERR